MIGLTLRGIRHLWRLTDASLNYILTKYGGEYDICEVVKTPSDFSKGEKMFIFNSRHSNNSNAYSDCMNDEWFRNITNDIGHSRVVVINRMNYNEMNHYGQYFPEITLLPKTFAKDYEAFIKENSKIIGKFEGKFGVNPRKNNIMKTIYLFSNGSKNFFQWAMGLYFQGVPIETIKSILQWNDNYKQLTKNLSKGTITAYTTRDSLIDLINELETLRNQKRANDAINSFNTTQKKLLKNSELTESDRKVLSRFSKLSEVKRVNFIKKVSSIEDINELMRQLRHVTSTHFNWSKESFIDFINNVEGINYEIVCDNGDIVLTKVNDYETIKQFGKTTNWCISKNKSYWNNYIENHGGETTQYMLFDFSKIEDDKLSIVGLTTTHNKGITSAHNFVNENLMPQNRGEGRLISSYLEKFRDNSDIYAIIEKCGIDISMIVEFDKPMYKWGREGLMEYLFECVNSENVDVLKDEDGRLALSVRDENLRYFFGDSYFDNIPADYWGCQHIIFVDFSKSQFDSNKVQFGIIFNGDMNADYCKNMYNEQSCPINGVDFDMKVIEYGLPYNVIRRPNDEHRMIVSAFENHNYKLLKDFIAKDKKVLGNLLKTMDESELYNVLLYSITDLNSFDYINMIYDNGYHMYEIMDDDYLSDLLGRLFRRCIEHSLNAAVDGVNKPSEETIEKFYNGTIDTIEEAKSIGTYLQFKIIFDNEVNGGLNYNSMYSRIISKMFTSHVSRGSYIDEIFLAMADRLKYNRSSDTVRMFFNAGITKCGEAVQKKLEELSKLNDLTKKAYEDALRIKRQRQQMMNDTVPVFEPVFAAVE